MSAGVVAGVAAGAVATFTIGGLLIGAASPSPASAPGTALLVGPLTPTAVPDAALAPWVIRAGSLCPAVPASVIAAQVAVASGWNAQEASSTARGIAQLGPGIWSRYGQDDEHNGQPSPMDEADALMALGRYDCALAGAEASTATRSGTPLLSLLLAAYDATPEAVAAAGGIPPVPAVSAYVNQVEALAATYVVATATPFGQAVVAAAEAWIGTPYVWGGGSYTGPTGSPAGFDCSGLVMYAVYQASHGAVALPHSSELQATLGQPIPLAAIQPGDVVALQLDGPGDYSHIVIYVGDGQVVAAPHTGSSVRVQPLSDFAGIAYTVRRYQ
ncbi:MAG TPA: NlpC/P60 family protein [Actinomycetota bacterium]|nr:NlpC/P60 family protein [Actinomycetota bacterium]